MQEDSPTSARSAHRRRASRAIIALMTLASLVHGVAQAGAHAPQTTAVVVGGDPQRLIAELGPQALHARLDAALAATGGLDPSAALLPYTDPAVQRRLVERQLRAADAWPSCDGASGGDGRSPTEQLALIKELVLFMQLGDAALALKELRCDLAAAPRPVSQKDLGSYYVYLGFLEEQTGGDPAPAFEVAARYVQQIDTAELPRSAQERLARAVAEVRTRAPVSVTLPPTLLGTICLEGACGRGGNTLSAAPGYHHVTYLGGDGQTLGHGFKVWLSDTAPAILSTLVPGPLAAAGPAATAATLACIDAGAGCDELTLEAREPAGDVWIWMAPAPQAHHWSVVRIESDGRTTGRARLLIYTPADLQKLDSLSADLSLAQRRTRVAIGTYVVAGVLGALFIKEVAHGAQLVDTLDHTATGAAYSEVAPTMAELDSTLTLQSVTFMGAITLGIAGLLEQFARAKPVREAALDTLDEEFPDEDEDSVLRHDYAP